MIKKDEPTTDTNPKKKATLPKRVGLVLLFACLLLAGILLWGNTSIQTSFYEVSLPAEKAGLNGYTIVQVSDLHNAGFGKDQKRLLNAIKKQSPDMIAVTGDIIDSSRTNIDVAMEFIKGAVEIAPVYYVTGNHEGWVSSNVYQKLTAEMEAAGVILLDNSFCTLYYEDTYFTLMGLMDSDMPGNNYALAKTCLKTIMEQTDDYTILLSHRPEYFDLYTQYGVNLTLSGHAHGGQFRLPFIGGLYAPNQGLFPQYTEGTFTEGNTTMVVSRGLGNSVIPLRINNRPELVVVTLTLQD